jgi:RNA polymerase sigma-70 factor, ECF subfamily
VGSNSAAIAVQCRQNFDATVARYLPALHRMALHQLGNHEDAEDAVQDALLSAFTYISQFEGRSHISTWLHRIVINSARMQLRGRHSRIFLSLDQTAQDGNSHLERQLSDSGLSPQQTCEKAELRAIVQQLLKHLSPKLRNALEL